MVESEEFFEATTTSLTRAEKVVVHLKPVSNAPILKQTRFKLSGMEPFNVIAKFVKDQLRTKESIFLYCNSSFSPAADELVADLYECFKVGQELIVNYAVTEAWG